jgi:chemotaxis protein CheD
MNNVVHVASGQARVVDRPARVCAIPSTGFAICAIDRSNRAGGILHVSRSGGRRGESREGWLGPAFEAFVAELSRHAPLRSFGVHVVGGADPFGILPRHVADEQAAEHVEWIAFAFARSEVVIENTDVGGRATRSVCVDLERGCVTHGVVSRPTDPACTPVVATGHVNVGIGDMAVAHAPGRLVTILGSCVGVALYSPSARIGGLAHVALPHAPHNNEQPSRYADTAVPVLREAMARAGAAPNDIVAKLAGGATLMINPANAVGNFAARNVSVVRESLEAARIPVISEDVGGVTGRKMSIDLESFRVEVQALKPIRRA